MPIRELSRRTGISPDLLRKWERRYGLTAPQRTPGGHRLYSRIDEARVRLMLNGVNRGMRPAQAAQHALGTRLGIASRPSAPGAAERAALRRQAIVQALGRYDEGAADAALEPLEAELSPAEVVRDVLWPLLSDSGAGSHEGIGPVALGWVERRLARLTAGWDRGAGPHALLAGDRSGTTTAWLLSFGLALHGFGWRITQFGGALPVAALQRAIRVARPGAVVFAVADTGAVARVVGQLEVGAERVAIAVPEAEGFRTERGGREPAVGSAAPAEWRILDRDPLAAAAEIAV